MEKAHPFRESVHIDFLPNPFDTPDKLSLRSVSTSRFSNFGVIKPRKIRKFKSARLVGDYEKPWLKNGTPKRKWDTLILLLCALIGIAIAAYNVYTGWISVDSTDYCLVFHDDFSNGINTDDWVYEQQIGGFGVQSFDWTTDDVQNIYSDGTGLHIVPTLTTESTNITVDQLLNDYTLNLTVTGTCTSEIDSDCAIVSNSTTGDMINPIRSGRLTTKGKHSIRYGKVEVKAKLPKGDWIWPAIWMMPEDSVYGIWPKSGEIDIMEARGNNRSYDGGRASAAGTLHWGPYTGNDGYWRTTKSFKLRHGDFSEKVHTFGVAWSDSYIYTYIDNQMIQSLYVPFNSKLGSMFSRGQFESTGINPWNESTSETMNAPFDQAFYLILNVAVGGANGYFTDGYFDKPWYDAATSPMLEFWEGKDQWFPTWGDGDARGMTVESVKMWSRGKC